MRIEPKLLVKHLTTVGTRILESSVGRAAIGRHPEITVVHFLEAALQDKDGETSEVLKALGLSRTAFLKWSKDLLGALPTQGGRRPTFSPELFALFEDAWVFGSLKRDEIRIRSGEILCRFLLSAELYTNELPPGLDRIDLALLDTVLTQACQNSSELVEAQGHEQSSGDFQDRAGASSDYERNLEIDDCPCLIDLRPDVEDGRFDHLLSRKSLELQVIEVLCRYQNPRALIVGQKGCGKSSLIRTIARRLLRNIDLPEQLRDHEVFALDTLSLAAGTSYRGSLEERINEVVGIMRGRRAVLLIDELHSALAGGRARGYGGEVLSLLISLTSIEDVRLIVVTDDSATGELRSAGFPESLFVRVKTPAMNDQETIELLSKLKPQLEAHSGRSLTAPILAGAVKIATGHLPDIALPGSAVNLLDQATAKALVLNKKRVTQKHLTQAVAQLLRIDADQVELDQMIRLLGMEDLLKKRVVGQDHAIKTLSDVVRMTKVELDLHPNRPDGVFLFVGPTGVGKTELARALAEVLDPAESTLIRLDMSEFAEQHAISRLIGSPPGYVDSNRGGQLTESLRRNPATVVLLDEIEKAHPKLYDLFLQVFDSGKITDSLGREFDCSHATFVMTSNAGSEDLVKAPIGFSAPEDGNRDEEVVLAALRKVFRPEFLNRIDSVMVFNHLSEEVLRQIVALKLDLYRERFVARGFDLECGDAVIDEIIDGVDRIRTGARGVVRKLERKIAIPVSRAIIADPTPRTFSVDVSDGTIRVR